jgi:hypothetical protein
MTDRPAPPREAPEGQQYVAVEDRFGPGWRLVTGKRCRFARYHLPACGQPAVAELDRGRRAGREKWWAYCPAHLYGRWVEDGKVMCWVVRERPGTPGDSDA